MNIRKFFEKIHLVKPRRKKSLAERFPEYSIGKWSYGRPIISRGKLGIPLTIGSFVSIASGVQILLASEHRLDWVTTFPFNVLWDEGKPISGSPWSKGAVVIGNDVWIGQDALILSGVTIGDGAVIGARTVVAKDVPPYSIVAGNPARLIRKRFDDGTIQRLLDVKWWDWPDEKITGMLPLLLSSDLQAFLDAAENRRPDSARDR